MVDTLEGREEALPDNWIDRIEELERDFGCWYVETEKKVFENEWLAQRKEEEERIRVVQSAESRTNIDVTADNISTKITADRPLVIPVSTIGSPEIEELQVSGPEKSLLVDQSEQRTATPAVPIHGEFPEI